MCAENRLKIEHLRSQQVRQKPKRMRKSVGVGMPESEIEKRIFEIARKHKQTLEAQISGRKEEMESDENSHYLIYSALGIPENEGKKIDVYQNIGRFVYRYAGQFLEEVTQLLINHARDGAPRALDNTVSNQPKRFEIDSIVEDDKRAHEIKWRDATTDGDHIDKENRKIQTIQDHGYKPIRIMFYMPERKQATRIQKKVIASYRENGEAHIGEDAWRYVENYTGYDLEAIIKRIVEENALHSPL